MVKEAVRAIIKNEKHQVLLGLRPPCVFAGDKYSLLGGKLEKGETPTLGVIREIAEESGLAILPKYYRSKLDVKTDSKNAWLTHYYIAEFAGILHLQPSEVVKILFVDLSNLSQLPIAFDHKEVLLEYFSVN